MKISNSQNTFLIMHVNFITKHIIYMYKKYCITKKCFTRSRFSDINSKHNNLILNFFFLLHRITERLIMSSQSQAERVSLLSSSGYQMPLWNTSATFVINDTSLEVNRVSWITKDGMPIRYELDSSNMPMWESFIKHWLAFCFILWIF